MTLSTETASPQFLAQVLEFFGDVQASYARLGLPSSRLLETMLGDSLKAVQATGYVPPELSADYQNICALRELLRLYEAELAKLPKNE